MLRTGSTEGQGKIFPGNSAADAATLNCHQGVAFVIKVRLLGDLVCEKGTGMVRWVCFLVLAVATVASLPLYAFAGKPVGLRINTAHGLSTAQGAVLDAGLNLATDVAVTASSQTDGTPYLTPDKFIVDAKAAGATILSSSFSGWNAFFDALTYLQLTRNGMIHVYAYEPKKAQQKNVPPPAAFTTVNLIGSTTGDGIEFGMPVRYMNGKGASTTASGAAAQLAGLMAALKYRHPAWNWFDVKAALRATATNYASGYAPLAYGYGTIDYHAANAMTDAAQLPLFAPAAVSFTKDPNLKDQLHFFVNSFKQTRRVQDVLFKFHTPPAVHLQELTLPEITALGGQWVFSGDISQDSNILTYRAGHDEILFFVWFTVDSKGNYSRIEQYSVIGPAKLTAEKQKLPGPRL